MEGLKVVIAVRDGRASVGVQAPDCDPVFTTVEGDLAAALERVRGLVEEARARWEAAPRYPRCERPLPAPAPAAPAPARQQARASSPAASPQPRMF